jgi:hypothetical protein
MPAMCRGPKGAALGGFLFFFCMCMCMYVVTLPGTFFLVVAFLVRRTNLEPKAEQ